MANDRELAFAQANTIALWTVFVFVPVFGAINMASYWESLLYYVPPELKNLEVNKAAAVGGAMRLKWWNRWGLLVLDVLASTLLVAAAYQVVYTYGLYNQGKNLALMFSMVFVSIILKKCDPVVIHYYSYQKYFWYCALYGFCQWAFAVATFGVLLYYSDNNTAGWVYFGYLLCNTILNLSLWIQFWSSSTYDVTPMNTSSSSVNSYQTMYRSADATLQRPNNRVSYN